MRELDWDETDVMTCLEVEPVIDDYGIEYVYRVSRGQIELTLAIFPLDRDIYTTLSILDTDTPLLEFCLRDCVGIQYHMKDGVEYLEFAPGKAFGQRYANDFVIPVGFRLFSRPVIAIRFF